jgi:hypothetical protein
MNKIILIVTFSLCLSPVLADESRWSDYPEHTGRCLEAMNFHMGDEKIFAELLAVEDVGKTDCRISVLFSYQENIFLFEQARVKKGLDPKNINYKGSSIEIVTGIGRTRH